MTHHFSQTVTHTCAGSITCLHRLHRGSRMISSCVIIFSSCFFLALFPGTLHSFILPSSPMFGSWWRGGRSTVLGGFGLFFPVNVIVLWSERSIQSDVFINRHYCVAHVGRWCNGLTRPHSQHYQQICPPDSLMSVTPIRSPGKDKANVFCFLLYIHFRSQIAFFFSNWLKTFYSFTSCSLSQLKLNLSCSNYHISSINSTF